jgi:NADPH:quinone reductase-like Zn-dependent oxidoreductase
MAKMRAVQVSRPKAPLEVVQRDIPEPGAGTVRIKVEACGICHSDSATVEGILPGIEYPRIPGHEVMGTIDAVGPGVAASGWGSASAWDGTLGTTDVATLAVAGTSSHAGSTSRRAYPRTAGTPST